MKKIDIVGKRFGSLTVLDDCFRRTENNRSRLYFKCRCDCGSEKYYEKSYLLRRKAASCESCCENCKPRKSIHTSGENRLTIDRLSDTGCINIVCAMLENMSLDFRHAFQSFLKDPLNENVHWQYERIRKEFTSDYFKGLTHLDGEAIVKKLEGIVRNEPMAACA